ncbi:MAG: type II toxin-antitoxin system VapC family toxin [Myxococcales bacterium]|nr:type II toxin-antitoxin system VapC family toxin [Myxococcales bacterium]
MRLLTRDDPQQAAVAAEVMRGEDLFVSKTVLLELEWVLRFTYRFEAAAINRALRGLLGLPTLTVEDSATVLDALDAHAAGLDFADALHLAASPKVLPSRLSDAGPRSLPDGRRGSKRAPPRWTPNRSVKRRHGRCPPPAGVRHHDRDGRQEAGSVAPARMGTAAVEGAAGAAMAVSACARWRRAGATRGRPGRAGRGRRL